MKPSTHYLPSIFAQSTKSLVPSQAKPNATLNPIPTRIRPPRPPLPVPLLIQNIHLPPSIKIHHLPLPKPLRNPPSAVQHHRILHHDERRPPHHRPPPPVPQQPGPPIHPVGVRHPRGGDRVREEPAHRGGHPREGQRAEDGLSETGPVDDVFPALADYLMDAVAGGGCCWRVGVPIRCSSISPGVEIVVCLRARGRGLVVSSGVILLGTTPEIDIQLHDEGPTTIRRLFRRVGSVRFIWGCVFALPRLNLTDPLAVQLAERFLVAEVVAASYRGETREDGAGFWRPDRHVDFEVLAELGGEEEERAAREHEVGVIRSREDKRQGNEAVSGDIQDPVTDGTMKDEAGIPMAEDDVYCGDAMYAEAGPDCAKEGESKARYH